jgi:FMN phosphatase YigB (HAD superfamily)
MQIIQYDGRSELEIERAIFDMDGTLYDFVSTNGLAGFENSELCKRVNQNAKTMIETLTDEDPIKVLNEARQDTVGISAYLGRAFGVNRNDYFETAWCVDPDGVIVPDIKLMSRLKELKDSGIRLTLLTAAPLSWQRKVSSYLGFQAVFDAVYTGDQFDLKDTVFQTLANEGNPSAVLSIGDQLHSDITPALRAGMNAVLVDGPIDTNNVIELLLR